MKSKILVLLLTLTSTYAATAQRRPFRSAPSDVLSVGIGAGMDYGGLGGSLLFYPQKNFGLFVGAGYAFAGFAYNGGLKLRLTSLSDRFQPYLLAMYGHNAVITMTNSSQSKLFYGSTFGVGVDIHPGGSSNYFSIALMVPIKEQKVDDYVNSINGHGISLNSTSLPVGFSIGYRFTLKDDNY